MPANWAAIETKPVQRHLVDHNRQSAAGENAQNDERKVGVVKHDIQQPAQTYVQEITWRMRLMDARIKTPHRQRKIHGIEVVEIMASKHETRDGNRARQKHEEQLLPETSCPESSNWRAILEDQRLLSNQLQARIRLLNAVYHSIVRDNQNFIDIHESFLVLLQPYQKRSSFSTTCFDEEVVDM